MMRPGPEEKAAAAVAAAEPVPVPRKPLFGGCWSCRLLCGAGLLAAAAWIYRGPRSAMKRGVPPSMAAIAQITFAIGVGSWGVVILVDPVGRGTGAAPPPPSGPRPPSALGGEGRVNK